MNNQQFHEWNEKQMPMQCHLLFWCLCICNSYKQKKIAKNNVIHKCCSCCVLVEKCVALMKSFRQTYKTTGFCHFNHWQDWPFSWKEYLNEFIPSFSYLTRLLLTVKQMGKYSPMSSLLGVHLRTNSPEVTLSFVMFRGPLIRISWTLQDRTNFMSSFKVL